MFGWLGGDGAAFRDPGGVRLTVNGAEIAELYPWLEEVSVETGREASSAAIAFAGAYDETGRWIVQDGEAIRVRDSVVIEAVFGPLSQEVFRGYVLSVQPSYPREAGEARVLIDCRDETLALDQVHRTRVWGADAPTSDREIAMRIAGEHGLILASDAEAGRTGLVLNQNASDIAFLRERARANGYELYIRAGAIHFGPMQVDADPQPTLNVQAGTRTSVLSFEAVDDSHRADAVRFETAPADGDAAVTGRVVSELAPMGLEPAVSRASAAGASEWRMARAEGLPEAELQAMARGIADREAMRLTAEAEIDGALYGHALLAGLPVGVAGVGSRYGGRWYVDAVEHRFSATGYTQRARLMRNAWGDDLAGAGGVLAAVL